MPNAYVCTVDRAGASVQQQTPDVPPNPVYLILTDGAGTFQKGMFYAADAMKNQILAVALTAVATCRRVYILADPPDPEDKPHYTAQCYEMDVLVD